jgi:hypothetical protein
VYQLESGSAFEQRRYESLIAALDAGRFDAKRRCRLPGSTFTQRQNVWAVEQAILDVFANSGPLAPKQIRAEIAHLGYAQTIITKALISLKAKGLLYPQSGTTRYCLLDEGGSQPLDVGAPIVFMPGLRSQRMGTITERKELKTRPGEIHAVAVLDNGQMLFVSEDTAKVNTSLLTQEAHQSWMLKTLRAAGPSGIRHNDLAAAAFKAAVPKVGTLIKDLVKAKKVRSSYGRNGSTYYVN